PDMPEVARALALSERSLRRRLAEEGWSFAAVLLEFRQLLARQLLVDSALPIKQVAEKAGFTSCAAFFRAFKRWTGESPAAFRSARARRARGLVADGSDACEVC
ncbi:MAG TPA: helix-turn-helix transcriptional regulator, partial [Polyangiales bacterium]